MVDIVEPSQSIGGRLDQRRPRPLGARRPNSDQRPSHLVDLPVRKLEVPPTGPVTHHGRLAAGPLTDLHSRPKWGATGLRTLRGCP